MAKRAGADVDRRATSVATAERRAKALELRKAGATYDQIARMVPYSSAAVAHTQVQIAIRALIAEPAKDVLELELGRLDAMLLAHWKAATIQGDIKAATFVLRVMDRRAKYLGLDVQNGPGDTSEVSAWLVAMGVNMPAPVTPSLQVNRDEPDVDDLI